MAREVRLHRGGSMTCLAIHTGKKSTRIFLTEDQAAHLGHRPMSFAAGNFGSETVATEIEPT